MDAEYIRNKITELRLKRGISEYQLSYELGHGKNYIRNITAGYSLPSTMELIYIIEYFGITPKDFFDEKRETAFPELMKKINDGLQGMNEKNLLVVLSVVDGLSHPDCTPS